MRSDELQIAAKEGDTETVLALLARVGVQVLALIARGADVFCVQDCLRDCHGYGFSGCVLVSLH
jgi:hypothetical protein